MIASPVVRSKAAIKAADSPNVRVSVSTEMFSPARSSSSSTFAASGRGPSSTKMNSCGRPSPAIADLYSCVERLEIGAPCADGNDDGESVDSLGVFMTGRFSDVAMLEAWATRGL